MPPWILINHRDENWGRDVASVPDGATMYVTSGRTRVKAWAPAKLNLFLEVLGRRDDGFHELDTLMLPIGLWDLLTAEPTDDGSIQLHAEWAMPSGRIDSPLLTDRGIGQLPDAEQNLVYRAFELVRKTHCEPRGVSLGAVVRLWKRIPSEAGMGGGSSDAATALMLANRIWNLHLPFAELAQLAAHLGSDVPFFLYSSSCLCRGRGEIVTPVSSCQSLFFVIVKPPLGLSTAKVFQHTEIPRTPNDSGAIINALSNGTVDQVGKRLFNRLQSAAVSQYESIAQLARVFKRLDVVSHQMTGSGSCYFGLCRNAKHARHLAQTLNSKNLGNAFAVQSARVPISRRLCEQPGQN